MFKSAKKFSILLVALLVCATFVFAACDGGAFKGVTAPAKAEVENNGGIAVKYGEWLYYVNGIQTNASAENTYVDVTGAPRIGSIVRIKLSAIEELFDISDNSNLTNSEKSEQIAAYVRSEKGAETVVPNIYYSANTTSTRLTGIYIFGERLYITTPNDELTAGGSSRTSELVLTSYKLDGTDPQRHFVFTDNTAQIWLTEQDGKVIATYLMSNTLYLLDVAKGESTVVTQKGVSADDEETDNTVSSVNWDYAGECLFFLNADGSICKLNVGASEYEVIVENEGEEEEHEDHNHAKITYTISSVNAGYVYYTVSDSNNSFVGGVKLYYATSAEDKDSVALNTNGVSGVKGWKAGKIVITKQQPNSGLYGLYVINSADGKDVTEVLSPEYNDSSITIDRIEGDILYYTANSTSYWIDLSKESDGTEGTVYAKSLSSATSWALPDLLDVTVDGEVVHYVINAASGSVSILKFDPETKTNSSSVALTLTAEPVEE